MKKESGVLYHADGKIERVLPQDDKTFQLEELQKHVGGYIEKVPGTGVRGNPLAYCDEEGMLKNLPLNREASTFFQQQLCGNVLQVERR